MRILKRDEAIEAASVNEASQQLLTQRAGYAIAQFCIAQFKFRSVCVVCGKGGKGAAGLAAAAVLASIAEKTQVIVLAEPFGNLSPGLAADLPQSIRPIWIRDEPDLHTEVISEALSSDLIIDAIIGTGYQSPLRPLASAAVAAINRASGTVISVDVSGGNRVFAQGVIALGAPIVTGVTPATGLTGVSVAVIRVFPAGAASASVGSSSPQPIQRLPTLRGKRFEL